MSSQKAVPARANISVFGSFQIDIDGHVATDELNRSKKMWNLLAYLVLNHNRSVSPSELVDALWPEEDSDNPTGALKTLLHRTRGILEPVFGKDIGLISSYRGAYSWNREITCKIDAEEFERLCMEAEHTGSKREKERLYSQAISLYRGDVLPKLSMEMWVVPISTHYHGLYLRAVKKYADLLLESKNYAQLANISTKALQVDQFDEDIHALLVQALLYQGNDAAALNAYETATDLLYRNLGVKPSERLRELYSEIMKVRKSMETDLGVIQDALAEHAQIPGPFVCDFGFFKEAYRLEARRALRSGACIHLCLLTVTTYMGEAPEPEIQNVVMDLLLDCIKARLRRGDVVSRYSGAQYIIMLPNANLEDSDMVIKQILAVFRRKNMKKSIVVHHKLQPLELMLS